jgi:hypothetical protein
MDCNRGFGEMIAVVPLPQFVKILLSGDFLFPGVVRNLTGKIPLQFILSDTADVAKTLIHRDILQPVEIGEDAFLSNLKTITSK